MKCMPAVQTLAIQHRERESYRTLQALMLIRSNKGAGPMLALAALREHGRLRDSAIEVGCLRMTPSGLFDLTFKLRAWQHRPIHDQSDCRAPSSPISIWCARNEVPVLVQSAGV